MDQLIGLKLLAATRLHGGLVILASQLWAIDLPVWASKLASRGSVDKWWHHEACIEATQSCEDTRTVGCTVRKMAPCIVHQDDFVV